MSDYPPYVKHLKETGIPCFNCKKRSGIDCANREPNESTLCDPCLQVQLLKWNYEQAQHLLNMLNKDDEEDEDKFGIHEYYRHLRETCNIEESPF